MLQDATVTNRREIRKAAVTQKFGELPEGIIMTLDEMLKDGKISSTEYIGFVTAISKSKSLSYDEKKELSAMIAKWGSEDMDEGQQAEELEVVDFEEPESVERMDDIDEEETETPSEKSSSDKDYEEETTEDLEEDEPASDSDS